MSVGFLTIESVLNQAPGKKCRCMVMAVKSFFGVLGVLAVLIAAQVEASDTLLLSGRVDPEVNVVARFHWSQWELHLESANGDEESFWVQLGPDHRVLMQRTAVVDLVPWVPRGRITGKPVLVTIASP